jgi:8-oxo-dGTP pyrophosphatase MutT (NUDIX family)
MPVEPLPAATLLLLRDGAGSPEVLMLERHRDQFFSGALVFPGGRVDEADRARAILARCGKVKGAGAAAMAFRVAAIRESYEEAGILLARRCGEDRLIAAAALADADAKRRRLVFATRLNLMRLQRSGDAAAALAATHTIARICPEVYDSPSGPRIRIPEGFGYEITDFPTNDPRHG